MLTMLAKGHTVCLPCSGLGRSGLVCTVGKMFSRISKHAGTSLDYERPQGLSIILRDYPNRARTSIAEPTGR